MALVKRGEVPSPELRRVTVAVEALKGEVVVTELTLTDRLAFEVAAKAARGSARKAAKVLLPQLLALAVLDADDEPLYDAVQWQAFGAKNRDATIELFNTAFKLSGFDGGENSKNF